MREVMRLHCQATSLRNLDMLVSSRYQKLSELSAYSSSRRFNNKSRSQNKLLFKRNQQRRSKRNRLTQRGSLSRRRASKKRLQNHSLSQIQTLTLSLWMSIDSKCLSKRQTISQALDHLELSQPSQTNLSLQGRDPTPNQRGSSSKRTCSLLNTLRGRMPSL